MSLVLNVPEPGQLVDVRQRRYVVVDASQSVLPPELLKSGSLNTRLQSPQIQHLLTLTSVEDDSLSEEMQVIWEVEPGAKATEKNALPAPVGFDSPYSLDTFLNAVRWGAVSSADIKALQSPFRSGIGIEDSQLDPVTRAVQMSRDNLLIADDVGLGKTIESRLVCQELIIRHRARKILIICPAPLQVRWRNQISDKFGLEFRIVDSDLLKLLSERVPGVVKPARLRRTWEFCVVRWNRPKRKGNGRKNGRGNRTGEVKSIESLQDTLFE